MPSLKMNFWISHSVIKLIIEVFSILFLWIRVGVVSAWIVSMSHHTQPQSVLFCLLPHFHVCVIVVLAIKPRALVMMGKCFNPPALKRFTLFKKKIDFIFSYVCTCLCGEVCT